MPTQAAFDGHIEDVLGAKPEDHGEASAATASGADPLQHRPVAALTISLRSRSDWRAFEERADCTVFQTFDWLSTWLRNIGVREGVKPAIVIGRHAGRNPVPDAVRARGEGLFARSRWLGTSLCNYNGPVLAARFLAAC